MKKFLMLLLVIGITYQNSFANNGEEYAKAIHDIQRLPTEAIAVPRSSDAEQREVIKKLGPVEAAKLFGDKGPIITESGAVIAPFGDGDSIMYKGDFDNSGGIEYLFLVRPRSDAILGVYKLVNDKLVRLPFNETISPPVGDLSQFHMNVAMPFAYVKDKKTYLRYMDYSPNYNKSELLVSTYLWEGKSFKFIEEMHP